MKTQSLLGGIHTEATDTPFNFDSGVDPLKHSSIDDVQLQLETAIHDFELAIDSEMLNLSRSELIESAAQASLAISESNVALIHTEAEDGEAGKGRIRKTFEAIAKWFQNLIASGMRSLKSIMMKFQEMGGKYVKLAESLKNEKFEGLSGDSGVKVYPNEPVQIIQAASKAREAITAKLDSATGVISASEILKEVLGDEDFNIGFQKTIAGGDKKDVALNPGDATQYVKSLGNSKKLLDGIGKMADRVQKKGKDAQAEAKKALKAVDSGDKAAVETARTKLTNLQTSTRLSMQIINRLIFTLRESYSARAKYVKKAANSVAGNRKDSGAVKEDVASAFEDWMAGHNS